MVTEIVLTGGACGGKTTALGGLAHLLRVRGHQVITVPEAFTMIVSGGVTGLGDIVRADGTANCDFQQQLFSTIRAQRHRAQAAGTELSGESVVILYDRGELDALAFHDHDCFERMAAEQGTTVHGIRDSYDAVMHLVTTADGAEDFYSHVTNVARWETAEEARASDARLYSVWAGNPSHHRLDNSTDFDGKLNRLLGATLATVEDEAVADVPGRPLGGVRSRA